MQRAIFYGVRFAPLAVGRLELALGANVALLWLRSGLVMRQVDAAIAAEPLGDVEPAAVI